MKRIIYMNQDGYANVVVPTPEMFDAKSRTRLLLESKGIVFNSDEEILNWIINKDVPKNAEYYIIDETDLPADRYFRNAWIVSEKNLVIDMDKARNLQMDKLRVMRTQKFIDMGFPYKLNPQVETAIVDAATQKTLQDLRDIPQTYDLTVAKTPDELKVMIPDILK